jgi:hypothetical protein
MAKNKSDSERSWKRGPPKDAPQSEGVEERPAEGPPRVFDGRVKRLDAMGAYFQSAIELPDSSEDWSAASLPAGGQKATFGKGRKPRKHLPPKRGNPGPM